VPLFAYIGHDGPRGIELRKVHRPAHLTYFEPIDAAGRIRHAGPLLDPAGEPVGSVILFEADDLAAARAVAARDPYVAEGIFERHEVHETRVVFPR
jgi:uncharacterized protein YciI